MIFVSKPGQGDPQSPPAADELPVDQPAHAPGPADTAGTLPADPAPQPVPAANAAATTAIVVALVEEVAAVATDQEARGFFAALGRRIAAAHTLGHPTNLAEMEAAANAVLAELGWGSTRLQAGQNGIRIIHQDWPAQLAEDAAGHWADAFALILAAIYGRWFASTGAPDDLQTAVVTRTRKTIELHHGHAEA